MHTFYSKYCKKLVWKSYFGLLNAVFKHRKLIQTEKPCHAKSKDIKHNLILLQINSLYTNDPENQVVVCYDNYSRSVKVACEYFSISSSNRFVTSTNNPILCKLKEGTSFSVRVYGNHADDRISNQNNLLFSGESASQSAKSSRFEDPSCVHMCN